MKTVWHGLICVSIVVLTGCGTVVNEPPPSDVPVSFSRDIQPVLTANCAGCHSPGGAADLAGIEVFLREGESYDLIVNRQSVQDPNWTIVKPGDPANSLLYLKVSSNNPPVGVRMPRFAPPLAPAQIDTIRRWIEEGAEDN